MWHLCLAPPCNSQHVLSFLEVYNSFFLLVGQDFFPALPEHVVVKWVHSPMSKIQHYILLFKSWNSLPWMNIYRFNKYLKGLQCWPRVSTDYVTNLVTLYSSPLIKSSTPLSSMPMPTLETLHFIFVLICEMPTFVHLFEVRCCSSVHLISVKAPLLCPVFFPLFPSSPPTIFLLYLW